MTRFPLASGAHSRAQSARNSDQLRPPRTAWECENRCRRVPCDLVAHSAGGRKVAGSNPVAPTKKSPANSASSPIPVSSRSDSELTSKGTIGAQLVRRTVQLLGQVGTSSREPPVFSDPGLTSQLPAHSAGGERSLVQIQSPRLKESPANAGLVSIRLAQVQAGERAGSIDLKG